LEKVGVERRVYTSGANKNQLDPFLPEDDDDIARLKAIQQDVHDVFIGLVKERRLGKLKAPDGELFSGAFWSAAKAVEFGLVDGIADIRSKMRQVFGDKVRLKVFEAEKSGLLSRLRRSLGAMAIPSPGLAFADDLVSAIETRTLWSRFGL
jgi:ClpP class serine protease